MKKPLLIHLPHSSLLIPDDIREDILLNDVELDQEMLKLTDRYTDELFNIPGVEIHKNKFSRIVFDPERFRSDDNEAMARVGMGVIYTHTSDGRLMRKLADSRREELKQRYYDPYHQNLEEKVQRLLELFGKCMILDGHSFPQEPLPFELDKDLDRPDICIGTSDFHTPACLYDFIEDYMKRKGLVVRCNFPFAGTMIPMKYYLKDIRVISVMIEINRKLYMNEITGEKNTGFEAVRELISGLVQELLENFMQV